MHHLRRAVAMSLTVLVVGFVPTASNSAAAPPTTVGRLFVPVSDCPGDLTMLQFMSVGDEYDIERPGVVTSMVTVTGEVAPTVVSLKVGRLVGGLWRITGTTPPLDTGPDDVVRAPTRFAVRRGDVLGVHYGPATDPLCFTRVRDFGFVTAVGDTPVGGALTAGGVVDAALPVQAVWEPDVTSMGMATTPRIHAPRIRARRPPAGPAPRRRASRRCGSGGAG